MKKLFGLIAIGIAGYAVWLKVAQEQQAKAVWTQVTEDWEN